MTKLEPTRTSSDLTATERLRRMLDERGVEYEGGGRSLRWRDRNGVMMQAFPLADGELGMDVWSCTPEQAIAATLGSSNCSNSERTSDSDATAERRGDAVEVVRCRDCKRFSIDNSDHDYRSGWWCHRWNTDMVKPDGFCAWGERRED